VVPGTPLPAAPSGVTDHFGRPVEGRAAEAFAAAGEIQAMLTSLSRTKATVLDGVHDGRPVFDHMHLTQFQTQLQALYTTVKFAMPYAACPYCRGAGCKVCKKAGWIPQPIYNRLPAEFKVPGVKDEPEGSE
jgi:hypothetical protein